METENKYFCWMLHSEDEALDPFQYRALGHYRRVCGVPEGICFESTSTTAKKCRMSEAKVREVRLFLADEGYIHIDGYEPKSKDGFHSGQSARIRIIDRMQGNIEAMTAYKNARGTPDENVRGYEATPDKNARGGSQKHKGTPDENVRVPLTKTSGKEGTLQEGTPEERTNKESLFGESNTKVLNGHKNEHSDGDDLTLKIYKAYPRKVAPGLARKAIDKALRKIKDRPPPKNSADWLLSRVCMFASSPAGNNGKHTKHPATWFNGECYDDDDAEWHKDGNCPQPQQHAGHYPGEPEGL